MGNQVAEGKKVKAVEKRSRNGFGEVVGGTAVVEKKSRNGFGEVVGGTAAECAAVCCCCPFTVMNLVVLAVYKMPACLCRKAVRRHRSRKRKRHQGPPFSGGRSRDKLVGEITRSGVAESEKDGDHRTDQETVAVDWEKEMWDRFYNGTGFWRNPSKRHED
ncbi:hypothetical protein K2173_021136 [Erythroxylum novogranatense]|uniref:Transmembrane protein n=1 Tax=Erythroxylum novogranatense TaxID=1862640 RepID=A0AAV8TP10_9ROSI|nr:hypothetical protein K2173_021136 [Erythroxylum novogranatense]